MDDWKLLSSDHRHYARRSSHMLLPKQSLAFVMPSAVKISFSGQAKPAKKTKESARMGFRIIMKLSVARTLSFYISNRGERMSACTLP